MLMRVAGGDEQEDAERDVNAEDPLVLPVDRRCRAISERARERVKAGVVVQSPLEYPAILTPMEPLVVEAFVDYCGSRSDFARSQWGRGDGR